jgi:hypothetical protein
MTESLASLSERALEDLRDVFARLPDDAADPLIEAIAAARHCVSLCLCIVRDVERDRRAAQLALTHDSVLSG